MAFNRKCATRSGKTGYVSIYAGKCFTGPNAKLAADRMSVAIHNIREKQRLELRAQWLIDNPSA